MAKGPLVAAAAPSLRPAARAYLLGYVSTVVPRLLPVLLRWLRRGETGDGRASIAHIIRSALGLHRFPAFCALLVGGSTWLQIPLRLLLRRTRLAGSGRVRLSRWLASFAAAYASLRLLQGGSAAAATTTATAAGSGPKASSDAGPQKAEDKIFKASTPVHPLPPAGRTLDLTLFAATRALDVVVGQLWTQRRARREASGRWTRGESLVGTATDPAFFALSSALVMWTWIYAPERLPREYDRWIASAAAVDGRLTEALRRCRRGLLRYGADLPEGRLLQDMCADYGWPLVWGDPARSFPFPCDMVHMGCGPSCERHALVRLGRSWRWAMATYLPLSLALALRPGKAPRGHNRPPALFSRLLRATLSATRSSAFLAAFVSLFFYGVCLARTRIGPRLLGHDPRAHQALDGGICTAAGCALCGWSILLERASRRKDLALFVAPRALATLLPRRYPADLQWRENLLFAASSAVVFTAVQEDPRRVRGVLGKVLGAVLKV